MAIFSRQAPVVAAFISTLCLAIMTYTGFSQTDEVAYIDPGVNLSMGQGFRSTAWNQDPGATWGCSTPAMPLVYAGWFKLFGFGKLQSRTLSIALHFAGLLAILAWARRRPEYSAHGLLVLWIGLTTLPVLVWACVGCRLEVFAFLFFAWFLSIAFPPGDSHRVPPASPILFGALTVLTGLHFSGYYAFAFAAVFLIQRSRGAFVRGLLVAVGMVAGAAALWYAYRQAGAWDAFMYSRGSHYDGRPMAWVPQGWRMFFVSKDITAMGAGVFVLLVLDAFRRVALSEELKRRVFFALAIYIAVPVLMNAVGIFYVSYAWMIALPIFVMLAGHVGQITLPQPRAVLAGLVVLFAAYLGAVGFRLRRDFLLNSQQASAAAFVLQRANAREAIAAGNEFYYALKPLHANLRIQPQSPAWPGHMYDEIKWVVASAGDAGRLISGRFSDWEEMARFPLQLGSDKSADDTVILRRR